MMGAPRITRQHNLDFLKKDKCHNFENFIKAVSYDIANFPKAVKVIRIHDSGDFFTDKYLSAWLAIIQENPTKRFFAYTKMISLVNRIRPQLPENFSVVQSVGGKQDKDILPQFPHAVVFPNHEEREKYGYLDGSTSDMRAAEGQQKIGLVYHGTRRLPTLDSSYKFLERIYGIK